MLVHAAQLSPEAVEVLRRLGAGIEPFGADVRAQIVVFGVDGLDEATTNSLRKAEQSGAVLVSVGATKHPLAALGAERPEALAQFIPCAIAIANERTARKAAEETAAFANRRFEIISAATRDGVAVHDGRHITFANRRFAELTGFSEQELVGMSPLELTTGDDRVRMRDHIARGSEESIRGTGLRKDGSTFLVEVVGRSVHVAGETIRVVTMRDVTATVAAERAREQMEASFQQLVESLPDGVIVGQEKGIAYVNPRMCAWLGYSQGELLGRNPYELVHPGERAAIEERGRATLEGPHPAPPREMRLQAKDGSVRILESTAMRVTYRGKPALVALFRDNTERRKLETRLRLSERLASMGTLVAGLAHEINNPLATIALCLELIARRQHGREPEDELVRDAREATSRAAAIVRDLKIFSRPEEDRRAVLDIHHVLESTLRIADHEIRHRARLVRAFGPVPKVVADEGRLGQVFLNLLVNAVEAIDSRTQTSGEGEVRVETCTDEAGNAQIEVRDNGPGIAPDILASIFDPFFTTKPVGVGTGLGLSICHRLVTDMGGRIEATSERGVGTTLRVTLPPSDGTHSRPSAHDSERTQAPHANRGGRVLLIDDDEAIGRVVRALLAPEHETTVVRSGPAALELFRAGVPFDIVFCDLMMPGMNGMDLYARVTEEWPDLARRFMFVTGGATTQTLTEFIEREPKRCLAKPFDPEELHAAVRKAIES